MNSLKKIYLNITIQDFSYSNYNCLSVYNLNLSIHNLAGIFFNLGLSRKYLFKFGTMSVLL